MPHYKDQSNALYFLPDSKFEYLLPARCVGISDEEAMDLLPKPLPSAAMEKAQIIDIERDTLMNRATREFMLLAIEERATSSGVTPELLYVQNAAYKAVKDVDKQIAQLRKKLK